jgi:hypothetical protein
MADIPNNADRAALAEILDVINREEVSPEPDDAATLREIQRIAVTALNDPPAGGDYWERWLPDPQHINALPQPVRAYLHALETNADPAGIVAENALLRDSIAGLEARLRSEL